MKRAFIVFLVAAAFAAAALAQGGDLAVLALKDAVEDARVSLAGSKIPASEPVAILPIANDVEARVAGLLKNALVAAGKTCVEGKEDPMWGAILKEIEWDERKEDILDAATLDKFGKLKSAKYLLYGCVRRLAADARYVLMEVELHCSSVATKEHVWGGSFVRRHYAPDADPEGKIEIPDEVRTALVKGIRDEIAKSLAASRKLGAAKKVALLPVFGDVDQYTKGLFRDVLAASSVTPVNLDVATRAEARLALREGAKLADALAYGVFRDIGASLVETKAGGEKIYRARMEMQLWIEKGASREILWSDTVRFAKEFSLGPRGWWDTLCHYFPSLADSPARIVWVPLVIVLALVVLAMFLRAATRVR
ncbi:MAG: hypothetical protein J6Z49_12175 [Kiritimatiellae bacterium]|nr:hypothetical protein [Kiritimatiellia bacterium]